MEPEEAPTPPVSGASSLSAPLLLMIAREDLFLLLPTLLRGKTCASDASSRTFVLYALPTCHLEHQLGQAPTRSRKPLVEAYRPDVLCLQEIKCVERASFPELELRALGFPHIAVAGQKGYHGVATLSRFRSAIRAPRHLRTRPCAASLGEAGRRRQGSRSCCTTSMCRQAATFPIQSPTRNSATSSTSSRRWVPGSVDAQQVQEPHDRGRRSQRRRRCRPMCGRTSNCSEW